MYNRVVSTRSRKRWLRRYLDHEIDANRGPLYQAKRKKDMKSEGRSPRGFTVTKPSNLQIGQSKDSRLARKFPMMEEHQNASGNGRGQDRNLY
ncbi:unnamed protein product [Linum trigynum]|uniref:Uncharacterized protein n=1 Tax=Linum trigynum TaxID=586398 RepID=A0AAV2G4X8_9ROSI